MRGRLAAKTEKERNHGNMGILTTGIRIGFRFGQRCVFFAFQVKGQILQAIH